MNDRKSTRFSKIVALVTERTRFREEQIQLLVDERTNCALTLEKKHYVTFEISRTEGVGHSGAMLFPDSQSLESAAKSDLQRLVGELPVRINQWLQSASEMLGCCASSHYFDRDAQALSYEWACKECDSTGKLPCVECKQVGSVTCSYCKGNKDITCPTCNGNCKHKCRSCEGEGRAKCSYCSGEGRVKCSACGGRGKQTCQSCAGRGHDIRYTQVVNDHGKGAFLTTREDIIPCLSCGSTGMVNCYICNGNRTRSCSNCEDGSVKCTKCSGEGVVDCNSCNYSGHVPCPNCKGQGKVACEKCKGETTVNCQACSGEGRRYISKITKASVRVFSDERFDATVPEFVQSQLQALGFDNYAAEGESRMISQGPIGDRTGGFTRRWEITFPTWKTVVSIGTEKLEFLAYGKSEHLYLLSGSIDALLSADREAVCAAVKTCSKTQIVTALKFYFQSPEHVDTLISTRGDVSASDRPDTQAAISWLTMSRKRLEKYWNLGLLTLYVICFSPAALGVVFPYDWVSYFLLPGIIFSVGAIVEQSVARKRTYFWTGSEKVADWTVDSNRGWSRRTKMFLYFILGLASTLFSHYVLYQRSTNDLRTLLKFESATPYSNNNPKQFAESESISSAPKQGQLKSQGNERVLGIWQGTYSCKGKIKGDIALSITPKGAVIEFKPEGTKTSGCFFGRWIHFPEYGSLDVDQERWLSRPLNFGSDINLRGNLKADGKVIEGILEKQCLDFKVRLLAPSASFPSPCNAN